MLKVSVVIPVKNEEQRIGRCLESLTYFDEVLLLDGNSTDRTREIANRFSNVRIVKQYDTDEPNVVIKDFSEVRNKGIHLARNEWILNGDADLIMTKEVVEEIKEILQGPECLVYDIPRKYLLDEETVIDFASTYTSRNRHPFFFFSKKLNPFYVGRIHARIEYDEKLTRRGRLKNHILNLYIEPPEVLRSKQRRFIEVEMTALKDENLRFKWWAGLMWHYSIRLCLQLWRILFSQVKGNVLKLGNALPWRYEKLKILRKINLLWTISQVYFACLLRRRTAS